MASVYRHAHVDDVTARKQHNNNKKSAMQWNRVKQMCAIIKNVYKRI